MAVERSRPDLVGAYLLDPSWPPPANVDELVGTGKLVYLGTAEAQAAVAAARVHHCFSPFELRRRAKDLRPPSVDHLGLRYSTTLYDLIPARHPERYLSDPGERLRYRARLELVRSADAVLAISRTAARDAREVLGIAERSCHVVGTGVSSRFAPATSRGRAAADLRRRAPDLVTPFLLCPAGHEPRKNVERVVDAFARLPARLRDRLVLVVTGDFPPPAVAHHRHRAGAAGVGGRVVLTGHVDDDHLRDLYRAAALVVFASLAEGYGLPVAEALACGTAACVSDRPPLDELVPDRRARFDPEDVPAMADVIARCLDDSALRASVVADGARTVDRWPDVAERVVATWDELAARPPRPWRPRRRVAVVSPYPPLPSGVAAYSAALVLAMRRAGARRAAADGGPPVEVDCFADGRDRHPAAPEPVGGAVPVDARAFERVDGATGSYEHVVYVLGNSESHSHALAALRRRPGVVLAHDVRLSGLLTFSTETCGAVPGGLRGAVARSYPDLPADVGAGRSISAGDEDRYGVLLLREVAASATRVLVSSEAGRRLAVLDAGPALADRIGVLPFAVSWLTAGERAAVEASRSSRSSRDARPPAHAPGGDRPSAAPSPDAPRSARVASFGIVDPRKRPDVVVDALATLVARGVDAELSLVGAVSEQLGTDLRELAASLGVSGRVHVRGQVSREEYLAELGRTDVAVQLRHRYSGESSGTVSECLSAAVPTVVSDVGWMAEIPDEAAAKAPLGCTASELADVLGALLATAPRRAALGAAGRRWADERTFDVAAEALLDVLGIRAVDGPP